MLTHEQYTERLNTVRERIAGACRRSGRDPEAVALVAVSKFHSARAVAALARCGQRVFGENYVQEALAKQEDLADLQLEWHFIGHLQSNKARHAAGRFRCLHTLDKAKLARALHNRAGSPAQPVLIQVNVGEEPQKHGVAVQHLDALAEEVAGLEGLRLEGLMCMPPFFDDPERARPCFARLRELRDRLERSLGRDLPTLSMGMSGDLEPAVEEGATLVRVGTDLFGSRPRK
jgi:hypothetical protein